MNKTHKKIAMVSGGVLTTGLIVGSILLIRKRNKKKAKGLIPHGGAANFITTNSNSLPGNFRNWKGGSEYLTSMPRGIRNNNPGNLIYTKIKWKGKLPKEQNKDRRFEMFIAPEYGVRAMIKDLIHDIKKGKNTVATLMTEYAPRFENNTDAYIQSVAKSLNVSQTAKLLPTKNTLQQLVFAISRVENGGNYITKELFDKAYALV